MTGKQKKYLKALAHDLKPVVNLGKHGISAEAKREIDYQLLDHELIKVKVLDASPLSKKESADVLAEMQDVEVVQVIGKTIVLYRPHPEEPVINLSVA